MTELDMALTPTGDPDDVAAPIDFASRAKLAFSVVGIGASAGGLEAFRQLFKAASPKCGIAYVVIQHLPPDHTSLLSDILGRCTDMPVLTIDDGMEVKPDHVFVIRPGHTVTLSDGRLRLGAPVELRGHRRPVDDFFRSLAREQREKSIAVVLSGMGTNGTAGAQAIKAVGGLLIAQDPELAEFPSMPQSLIHSGYADQVLAPDAIPAFLERYVKQPYLETDGTGRLRAAEALESHRVELHEIIVQVRSSTGHDFTSYKAPTVIRRIQRRMGLIGARDLDTYLAYLKAHATEPEALANDLMINVTGFFRDPEAWEAFRTLVLRPLVEQRSVTVPIRAWVTACASGEEAYTLAMLIAEESARARKQFDVKIFATDTADRALALARAGVYPGGIEADMTAQRLDQFFDKDDHTYRVRKELRQQVVFAPQDVLRDPPFSRVDIVTCRNLFIYLSPEAQRRALALMHFALVDGGHLLLGNAETLGQAEGLFDVVSKRWRVYRRIGATQHQLGDLSTLRSPELRPLSSLASSLPSARPSATAAIQTALLEEFGPPTAVVDGAEQLMYFHGDPAPYIMHPSGEPTQSLTELVRTQWRSAVRTALRQASASLQAVSIEQPIADEAGGIIRVTAAPLRATRATTHFRVSFERLDAQHSQAAQTMQPLEPTEAHAVLEDEVRSLKRELQSSVEAFEASNEELKASHEEVSSINEELQSSNEELETGKEELQSLNEELTTVNGQLQTKLGELEALTNDLDNLLSNTDIAVVFLDTQLNVRRFTPAIRDLLRLIPADVGRPVAHLAQTFTGGNLVIDATRVLKWLVPLESEVLSHSNRWYLRRTLPYRTEDNRIGGVVITFVDITARKHAEQDIAAAQERLQASIEQMPAAVLMLDAPSGNVLSGNRQAAALFNQPFPLPHVGQHWTTVFVAFRGITAEGMPYKSESFPITRSLGRGDVVIDEELDFLRPDDSRGTLLMSSGPVHGATGLVVAVVATFWDISERKQAQAVLAQSEERFRLLVESARDYAIFMLDPQGNIASWNLGAERVTGFSEREIRGKPGGILFTPEDNDSGVPARELREATETGSASDERWHLRKDGIRFWASGVTTAARAADGRLQGFVKIMRDHTERKAADIRLQDALRSAQHLRASAEHANRAKDEFISTVSHELRTPLNTIRLWSRMFASGKVRDHDVVKGGQMIDRAALAQQQLIDDLLDVSRMATGHLHLTLRDVPLVDTMTAALDGVRAMAATRSLSIEVDIDADLGVVRLDPDRMQQVLWNLLINAIKFNVDGGRVSVRARREDGTVEISIADSGMGIAPEFLPHLFDRFRQGQAGSDRRYGGLGLGLAIAKQLVELHGGTITAHSAGEGQGATFTIYLPLERGTPVALATAPTPTPAATLPDTQDLLGIDILLVEDESMSREATARLLEQWGARVSSVESAAQARDVIGMRRPDVIVADIGMPDEDGYTLLRQLRDAERVANAPRVPAIALTAFARIEDEQRAIEAGFDLHLPKPTDPERLLAALRRVLPHKYWS